MHDDTTWPRRLTSIDGKRTFNNIDGPDDIWFWAIVTGKGDSQDYDSVIVGFQEGFEPSKEAVVVMLETLTS